MMLRRLMKHMRISVLVIGNAFNERPHTHTHTLLYTRLLVLGFAKMRSRTLITRETNIRKFFERFAECSLLVGWLLACSLRLFILLICTCALMCYLGCRGRFYIARRCLLLVCLSVAIRCVVTHWLGILIWNIRHAHIQTVATRNTHHPYDTNALLITNMWNCIQITRRVIFYSIRIFKFCTECAEFFITNIPKAFWVDWPGRCLRIAKRSRSFSRPLSFVCPLKWISIFGSRENQHFEAPNAVLLTQTSRLFSSPTSSHFPLFNYKIDDSVTLCMCKCRSTGARAQRFYCPILSVYLWIQLAQRNMQNA